MESKEDKILCTSICCKNLQCDYNKGYKHRTMFYESDRKVIFKPFLECKEFKANG